MANRLFFCCLAFFLFVTISTLFVNGRMIEERRNDNEAFGAETESEALTSASRHLNSRGRYGRTLRRRRHYGYSGRGDDDDDGHYGRGGDDDDDGHHKRGGDDDDDDGHRRPPSPHYTPSPSPHYTPSPSPHYTPSPSPSGSSSVTQMQGVLGVVVFGNGRSCFVKVFQSGMSYQQQFGDSTSTSAFINLFGRGECEPGARGIAYGVVRAEVVAEAHRRGDTCESDVISFVTTRVNDPDPNDGVSVQVGGAAGGEALAVCN